MDLSQAAHIRITVSPSDGDRVYHVNADDVRVVLARLPDDVVHRLRAVHFNDRSRGGRCAGYVNRARREIALCALPPRMSCARYLRWPACPAEFGAHRGSQWPKLAIRRFVLYDVLLHEIGHLQIIDPRAKSPRRKFAMERRAEEFAHDWRQRLSSQPFAHPDPVHFRPTPHDAETAGSGPQPT